MSSDIQYEQINIDMWNNVYMNLFYLGIRYQIMSKAICKRNIRWKVVNKSHIMLPIGSAVRGKIHKTFTKSCQKQYVNVIFDETLWINHILRYL